MSERLLRNSFTIFYNGEGRDRIQTPELPIKYFQAGRLNLASEFYLMTNLFKAL
jgi:hypothetical protein